MPAAARHRLLVVGAVAVVLADIAGRLVPVAGGHGDAVPVDQGQGRGAGDAVGLGQLEVQPLPLGGGERMGHRLVQVRVQRQHLRQRAEAIDALLQGLRIQAELTPHLQAFVIQRPLLRIAPGQQRTQRRAAEHQDDEQPPGAIAGDAVHGASLGRAGRTRVNASAGRAQKCICARSSKISGWLRTPRRLASTLT